MPVETKSEKYQSVQKGREIWMIAWGLLFSCGEWMITDTYPSANREQKLFLVDMKTEAVISLGRYWEPKEFRSWWRCDLHPRWSPDGDMIGFNSTHTGSRQVYLFRLSSNY